jgi:peptidoglycan hydrolase-like protein with peptidoglycan-binding domain
MKLIIQETQLKKLVDVIKEEKSDGKLNVLFVGDSLSSGPGYTWNYKLANRHLGEWNSDHLVEGGKPTSWMLEHLERKLNQKKYDLVFIYGGTNDMLSLTSISQAIGNINKMVKLVEEQGGKAIVFAGYDAESVMSEKRFSKGGNLRPTKYCNEDCMLRGRSRMIEFQKALLSGVKGEDVLVISKMPGGSPSWAGDGTHVNGTVHDKMADYINDKITGNVNTKDKSEKKDWDFGFNFLGGFKKFLSKYLSSPFGSLFGEKKLTNKFVSDLEKITEHNINRNTILTENKILETGDVNEKVALFQLALQLLGYSLDKWGVDGIFGPETKKAVKDFQRDNNLEETGKITTNIKNKIISMIKNTITDEDFAKINFTKTESLPSSSAKFSGNNFEKIALNKYGEDFVDKVRRIGEDVGLDYKIILAIMYFESGIDPSAVNSETSATGLIQFTPSTAKSLGTTVGELRTMSAIEQLDYVKKFFQANKRLIPSVKSPEDAYFLVFYPVAVTKDDSFILGSERSNETARLIAKKNPVDANNDGVLSKGEVKAKLRQRWGI